MKIQLIAFVTLSLLQIKSPVSDSSKICSLLGAGSGDIVEMSGEVTPGGHDVLVVPENCTERVILDWPSTLRSDPEFRKFESLLSVQRDPEPNVICRECPKYRVWAEFRGPLDRSTNVGLVRDRKTGSLSLEGYGHPLPFTRYRLTVTAVRVLKTENRN